MSVGILVPIEDRIMGTISLDKHGDIQGLLLSKFGVCKIVMRDIFSCRFKDFFGNMIIGDTEGYGSDMIIKNVLYESDHLSFCIPNKATFVYDDIAYIKSSDLIGIWHKGYGVITDFYEQVQLNKSGFPIGECSTTRSIICSSMMSKSYFIRRFL